MGGWGVLRKTGTGWVHELSEKKEIVSHAMGTAT